MASRGMRSAVRLLTLAIVLALLCPRQVRAQATPAAKCTPSAGYSCIPGESGQATLNDTNARFSGAVKISPTLGGAKLAVLAVTNSMSPYTVGLADSYIDCNASAGAVTLNLPAAAHNGRVLSFKKTDSSINACTITAAGSDTIDGTATFVLGGQYQSVKLVDFASGNGWGVTAASNIALLPLQGNLDANGYKVTNGAPGVNPGDVIAQDQSGARLQGLELTSDFLLDGHAITKLSELDGYKWAYVPTGSTLDLTLQSLVNDIQSIGSGVTYGGGTIMIPPGDYSALTANVVNSYRNVTLVCAGPRTTHIGWLGSGAFYEINDSNVGLPGTGNEQGAGMIGCDVDMTGNTHSKSGAVKINNSIGVRIEHNEFYNATTPDGFGVWLYNTSGQWNERHWIKDNEFNTNQWDVLFEDASTSCSGEHNEIGLNFYTIHAGQAGLRLEGVCLDRGSFAMNGNAAGDNTSTAISSIVETGNTVNVVTSAAHTVPTDRTSTCTVQGNANGFNGVYNCTAPDSTHVQFSDPTAGLSSGGGGTISLAATLISADSVSSMGRSERMSSNIECDANYCAGVAVDSGGVVAATGFFFGGDSLFFVNSPITSGFTIGAGEDNQGTTIGTGNARFGGYVRAASGLRAGSASGFIYGSNVVLANGANVIGSGTLLALVGAGRLIVSESIGGRTCDFDIRGGANTVSVASDTSGICSATCGTASKLNVCNSAANIYELENKLGSSATINMTLIRIN